MKRLHCSSFPARNGQFHLQFPGKEACRQREAAEHSDAGLPQPNKEPKKGKIQNKNLGDSQKNVSQNREMALSNHQECCPPENSDPGPAGARMLAFTRCRPLAPQSQRQGACTASKRAFLPNQRQREKQVCFPDRQCVHKASGHLRGVGSSPQGRHKEPLQVMVRIT